MICFYTQMNKKIIFGSVKIKMIILEITKTTISTTSQIRQLLTILKRGILSEL